MVYVHHVLPADLTLGGNGGVKSHCNVSVPVHAGKDEEGGVGSACRNVRQRRLHSWHGLAFHSVVHLHRVRPGKNQKLNCVRFRIVNRKHQRGYAVHRVHGEKVGACCRVCLERGNVACLGGLPADKEWNEIVCQTEQ